MEADEASFWTLYVLGNYQNGKLLCGLGNVFVLVQSFCYDAADESVCYVEDGAFVLTHGA